MNRLSTAKRVQLVSALVEGNSFNAVVRITGVAKHTVLKLIEDMGCACAAYGYTEAPDSRYSPAACIGCDMKTVSGVPDPDHVSTSFVERQNLTRQMCMRRFTRLTNGFSKKIENHGHAVALHFMHYNFCRVHKTPRVTPAMEAGIANHVWTMEELILGLLPVNALKKAA